MYVHLGRDYVLNDRDIIGIFNLETTTISPRGREFLNYAQKNGAVVRRLVGYGRFDGAETARVMARLYAAARLHVNFFQPSFKLKEKRREGAKVIKRYHLPATPYARALAHPKVPKAIKRRLRETYRTLDPVALLAEMRRCQQELGMAFSEWRQRLRFLHAISLLEQGKTVQSIALDVGYSSASAFIAMFQQIAGTTPERFRRNNPLHP